MTVVMQQRMPDGVPIEMIDEVTARMGVNDDPPAGLVVHVHFEQNGHVHVVDVWNSEQELEQFRQNRLMPTMEKVAAEHGMDVSQMPQPEQTITEVREMVRGR